MHHRLDGQMGGNKVTFVISPLISLIEDQVTQMNEFIENSAVYFSAGSKNTDKASMARLKNPLGGICLVYVTPEKINKSKKMMNTLVNLYNANRLARFVIDEAHCVTQDGHDFRPDYAKLNVLRQKFPQIPIIAVTATANATVQSAVCKVLKLQNVKVFRTPGDRANLTYSIRTKPDKADDIVDDIASFIKSKHASEAGIVYTLSRNDSETVAAALCDRGIVSEPYHSMIDATRKKHVHDSWMRNDTQVVVATIAFGMGINKSNVR